MREGFAGKVVVLTGASQGIGRALAIELASRGARLALVARDAAALEAVAAECRARGAEAHVVAADVGVQADCRRLVDETVSRFVSLDVLVLNAGITMWARADELEDVSVYERLLRVNVLGSIWPTLFALPHLKRARGRIVAVASLAGLTGVPTRSGYAASKHAMVGFFDSLRIELDGTGVSVTIVAPDFVVTEIHRRAIGADGLPLGATPMQESRILTAAACARMIADATETRRRLLITSFRGKAGRWVRLVAPGLIDAIAKKAIREGR